jgi:putative Ca2+/H+ antiporter (TMEM165/GDT1 family)
MSAVSAVTNGIAYAAKAVTAATAVLTSVAALNLLPEQYAKWVSGALAVLGVLSVYLVPNRQTVKLDGKAIAAGVVSNKQFQGVFDAALPPLTEPPADLEDPA